MSGTPGLAAARAATVELTTPDARPEHLGVGLLLDVPGRGAVVLTCHHVVAPVAPGAVRVVTNDGDTLMATLDEDASTVERDAAVLTLVPAPVLENPMLHVPHPDVFDGDLPGTAVSPGHSTETFDVRLRPADELALDVPHPPGRYVLPKAFRLDTTDSRRGTSGSPVYCELGVVGLVDAAREQTAEYSRLGYLNPLTAWEPGLPGLKRLMEPFATRALRERAGVVWAGAAPDRALEITGPRTLMYVPRPEDEPARRAFAAGHVRLVGRSRSGKSRLLSCLLAEHPDAVVVLPGLDEPPPSFEAESDFRKRDVVLVFENVHLVADSTPVRWYERLCSLARSTKLVLTSLNAADWEDVENTHKGLLRKFPAEPVFLSKDEGEDLPEEVGLRLAQQVDMDEETFRHRFDGTPGSVVIDADVKPEPPEPLPAGAGAGAAIMPVTAAQVAKEIPTNLPRVTTTFVDREAELREAAERLGRDPLLVLTGDKGAGKTRLAVELGTRLAGEFPDGVWYADLSSARDDDQVVRIVADSTRAPRAALLDAEDALVEYLRPRRTLVVMNGADAVRATAEALAARLTAPGGVARAVITVRETVATAPEHRLGVAPLGTGEAAKHLFIDRIEAGGAELTAEDRSRAEQVCRDLGGLPGAIEVAAGQVRQSGLKHVAELHERDAARGAPEPEDVLRLAVVRSLSDVPAARAVFARLSVMPDWFSLDAARAIVADPEESGDFAEHVRTLVDRRLVLIDARADDGERFRLLPSLRDVAAAELPAPDGEALRGRHAAHFLALAEQAAPRFEGRAATRWVEHLERERIHLRTAVQWALEHDLSMALRLSAALWMLFIVRSRFAEGRQWLDLVLAKAAARPEALAADDASRLADVATGAGYLAYHQGDYGAVEKAVALARTARARPGTAASRGDEVDLRGLVARRRCEFEAAVELLSEAAAVSERRGDRGRLADRLNTLGNAARERRGSLDEAARLQDESFRLYKQMGSARGCAMVQCDLGYVLMDRGEHERAGRYLERSRKIRRSIGDVQGEAQSINGLGTLARLEGRPKRAIALHRKAHRLFDQMGDRLRTAESLEALGLAEVHAGREGEGRRHLEDGLAVRLALGALRPPTLVAAIDDALEAPPAAA